MTSSIELLYWSGIFYCPHHSPKIMQFIKNTTFGIHWYQYSFFLPHFICGYNMSQDAMYYTYYLPTSIFFNSDFLRVFLFDYHRNMNGQEGRIIFCPPKNRHPFWTERLLNFLFIRGSKSLRWAMKQIMGAEEKKYLLLF